MAIPDSVRRWPGKAATIEAETGNILTYAELDERSLRFSHLLDECGLGPGDVVTVLMENNLHHHEVHWGTIRNGRRLTTLNTHLTPEEIAYIVNDSGARVIVATAHYAALATKVSALIPNCRERFAMHGAIDGWSGYEDAIARQGTAPDPLVVMGDALNYSSGTTGRPKGVVRRGQKPLTYADGIPAEELWRNRGADENSVYLCTAPLFHSAPLSGTASFHSLGGTVILMKKFDARQTLEMIEKHRVTFAQFVPTHFIRMLRLPEAERLSYDVSSLRVVTHAAAPCPPDVKRAMIDWFGPILVEFFGGTEQIGHNELSTEEWLSHPGSVGRSLAGPMHVCDEDGEEVGTGTPGLVYFETNRPMFEYHNDAQKTANSRHPRHGNWATIGDMGYVDADGYLYLTDRQSFVINSGGVNIYPQELENLLITHPMIEDAAVFGIPNAEMGEEVKAVVQLRDGYVESEALAADLVVWCRDRIAHYKAPRSIDFEAELPRLDNGKLYKHALRERHWKTSGSRILGGDRHD